ncbi:MAG: hypothetical protein QNL04_07155 [SAR324 cluster bacterium]|nr:hypothetical protein [SAR324 cluster bacterium]
MKSFLSATLTSAIAMWLLAGLWHGVIQPQFYEVAAKTEHEGTGIIALAYLILGLLMAYLYPRFTYSGGFVKKGLIFGGLIGVLWVFPHGLAMAGAHGEPLVYVFKNSLWHLVEQAFGGLVIAWIYKKFETK